ncbi:MAG: hypothetical protein ACTSWY_09820 [Promethearchaeota archaeon]
MSNSKVDLWDEVPSQFYIALGRRGQERIQTDQCFLENCDNNNIEELIPLEKKEYSSKKETDGSFYNCKIIKIKCNKCGKTFQFAMKTIFMPEKASDGTIGTSEIKPFMGMAYILDESGKNTGFIGYF